MKRRKIKKKKHSAHSILEQVQHCDTFWKTNKNNITKISQRQVEKKLKNFLPVILM